MNFAVLGAFAAAMILCLTFMADLGRHMFTRYNPNSANPSMGLVVSSADTALTTRRLTEARSTNLYNPVELNNTEVPLP